MTDDFNYESGNPNQIGGFDEKFESKSSRAKLWPIENMEFEEKYRRDPGAEDFVDTSGYMDVELDPMDAENRYEEKVKDEPMSDDDYRPDDNDYNNDDDYNDQDYEVKDKKPHRCQHCTKAFRKKSNLYGHIKRVHEGERPYPCSLCSKSFKMKQHLNTHIRGVHERDTGGFKN